MKNKKNIYLMIIFTFSLLLFNRNIQAQDEELPPGELLIGNNSSDVIKIEVLPVGAVFNGDLDYKLKITERHFSTHYTHIVGGTVSDIINGGGLRLDHDGRDDANAEGGCVGFGWYKVNFYKKDGSSYDFVNYVYIDWGDADYKFGSGYYASNPLKPDLQIGYYGANDIRLWSENISLPQDHIVRIYEQPYGSKYPNRNGFKTNSGDNWLNFPLLATSYQGSQPWGHENPEKCFLNVNILAQHQPKIICGDYFNLNLSVLWLKRDNTKLFIGNSDNNPTCGAGLTNGTGSVIILEPNTQIICEKSARLILRNQSNVRFDAITSKIFMKPGSLYCIEGSPHFYGAAYDPNTVTGSIIIQGLVKRYCPEYPAPSSPYFEDSIKVLLDTNATLEISDSTTWIFEGYESGLICKEGSTIMFGKGSKLVFTDGARINAKHTKFTSLDSNTTWNGIYLSGVSYDTLQYCIIENALNGINIEDKYSFFTSAPATEISNCEFSNKTSVQLLNMVYVNNSANVMIRNCISTSLINDGFASGVIVEYSTAGGVNIIDNEISNVTTGINVIQSSPYIARNTITGSGQSLPAAGRRNRNISR